MACALTCATCPVCADPEPIDGFDVVVQYGLIGDSLAVYLDGAAVVAGAQFIVVCSVGGKGRLVVLGDVGQWTVG